LSHSSILARQKRYVCCFGRVGPVGCVWWWIACIDLTDTQVAKTALDIIEGLSGSIDGIAALRPSADKLSNNLLLAIPRPSLCRSAATCLVNLSQDVVHCNALIAASACSRLITCVVEGKTSDHDLVTMTLSNITRSREGAEQALQVSTSALMYACPSARIVLHSTQSKRYVIPSPPRDEWDVSECLQFVSCSEVSMNMHESPFV
jgi:hypothetical protein